MGNTPKKKAKKSKTKTPHLTELFVHGQDVTISVYANGQNYEIDVWMQRPSPVHRDKAQKKARARRAATKAMMLSGEEQLAVEQEIEEMDKSEIVDSLVEFDANDMSERAQNDILYDKDVGSDWSGEGNDYTALLEAHGDRMNELLEFNEALEEGQEDQAIVASEDEELLRIMDLIEKFEKEKAERLVEIKDLSKEKYMRRKESELRKEFKKRWTDIEAGLAYYQEYRVWMLYYAIRNEGNHSEFYFENSDDVLELPQMVQAQFFSAYEAIDMGVEDIKNWLSLLNSYNLSE